MPSMAAVSILSRSSSVMLVRSLERAPARMKPVPQIGPEQPPTFFVMIMLIFSRNAPIELRSRSFQSCSTTRKPVASDTPKSASPAKESSSQKYCSFLSAVAATDRIAVSMSACLISFIIFSSPRLICSRGRLGRPLCRDRFQILERDEHLRRIAELGHDLRRALEVLVLRVSARRDQRRHAGAERREQAV